MTVLMIGIVAVAQLMPAAMRTNFQNRYDSTALIVAQRQLEQMIAQDLQASFPIIASGPYFFDNTLLPAGTVSGVAGVTAGSHRMYLGVAPNCAPYTAVACGQPAPPYPPNVPTAPAMSTSGAGLVTLPGGAVQIDWNAARQTGYWNQFTTPEGYSYETRWAVWTLYGNINATIRPVGKRIFISTRGGAAGVAFPPIQLTSMVGWRRD